MTSKRGFSLFDAKGKKDLAYASLYAHAGGMAWFLNAAALEEAEESACMASS